MANKELYRVLASKVAWQPTGAFKIQRDEEIKRLLDMLPSGSGWDHGTKLDEERSNSDKLVLYGEYHHMHDSGMYAGWTEHTITVVPDLAYGFTLKISGRNRNGIKDSLYEIFDCALRERVEEYAPRKEETTL